MLQRTNHSEPFASLVCEDTRACMLRAEYAITCTTVYVLFCYNGVVDIVTFSIFSGDIMSSTRVVK